MGMIGKQQRQNPIRRQQMQVIRLLLVVYAASIVLRLVF